jgi:hypothetical protein
MPTLAELKAENLAEEEKAKLPPRAEEPLQVETEAPEIESEEDGESVEPSGEPESWMKPEEEESDDDKEAVKFTDSDAANIRRKFKAKLQAKEEEKNAEIEKLRQEVEALKKNKAPSHQVSQKPKRDDFDDDDLYFEALTDYKISLLQDQGKSQQAAEEKRRQAEREQAEVESAVDAHYERAAKLAAKSGIKPEVYQSADRRVREVVDAIFPQGGDLITDRLISLVGDGSEKVFYHLGVNPSKMQKFRETFDRDKTGLAAAAYLGRLNAELSLPAKRESSAPRPVSEVQGDASGNASIKALAEKYKDAVRKGDAQKAYNIKKDAKQAGYDTKGW